MWLYMKTSKESLKQKENRTNYVYAVPSMSLDAFMAALVCKLAYCRGKKKKGGGGNRGIKNGKECVFTLNS